MNVEPIGSVMSLQSQGVQPVKPVAADNAGQQVNEAKMAEQSASTDLSSAQVVTSTPEAGDGAGSQSTGNQTNPNQPSIQDTLQQEATATNERLKEAVARFNKSSGANSEAVFGIHEGTNRVTIKIVDKKTKDVIKELPPEKTLDMIAKVWEMAGIMVDEKR